MIAFLLIDPFSSPYRLDRDTTVSGILLYGTEDIPSNSFAVEIKPTERFYLELIYVTTNGWLKVLTIHKKNDIQSSLST